MMDEMHIKEDFVFDRFIGYTDLGNVTDKLSEFERFVEERHGQTSPTLAKSMMVFMFRGLFTKLQFPGLCSVSSNVCLCMEINCTNHFGRQLDIWKNCGLKVRCFILT